MKKSQLEQLNASLDRALAPPRQKPKESLDALLDEYNDERLSPSLTAEPPVVEARLNSIPSGIPSGIPPAAPAAIPEAIPDGIPNTRKRERAKIDEAPPLAEEFVPLDATHTGSEKSVYSIMYRETVSRGIVERHFGPAELMKKTGIRSRNTVHKALYGLVEKLSVEVVSEARGNPLGPRYRVHSPKEIERRRKAAGIRIDPQTKQIEERGSIPAGIPAGTPPATPNNWDGARPEIGIPAVPNIGTVIKRSNDHLAEPDQDTTSSSNLLGRKPDDEAFAAFAETFKQLTSDLTGKNPAGTDAPKWRELAEVIATEARIAAGRTTVSSVPAFLAEHLRRRLFKKDKAQLEAEVRAEPRASAGQGADVSECPDCFGTGMFYPEGFEKGVAKCGHFRLKK